MNFDEPAGLTIGAAAAAIRSGSLSARDLIESCLERVAATEGDVQAWAHVAADAARMDARLRDTRDPASPLHAIPFGVKDIIEAADYPIEYGTPIYRNGISKRDAACVALLKESGAICLGKTVTTELAHFHPGKTRNPHRLAHTPGGSSSGSAAAVASGHVPLALGTQTTGSVLRPAAYCGVYGFKPSFGDVSRSGVMECVSSFDTVGWFARSIEDVEIARRGLMRLPHEADPQTLPPLESMRIGLFRGPDWDRADDETQTLVEGAAAALGSAGASVATLEPPPGFSDLARIHRTIAGFEFARAITWERTERATQLSPKLVEGRCGDGLRTSYEDYTAANEHLLAARAAFDAMMHDVDVLLTPVAAGPAPEGLAATGEPTFCTAFTALHVPALSIPAFTSRSGLPIGLQLVGRYRRDAALIGAAMAIAPALDVGTVRPVASGRAA